MSARIRRIDPIDEPALGDARWDYADTFEVLLDHPDDHAAERWLRAALEHTDEPVRRLIRLVHRNVVRFDLDRNDADGFIGWHQVVSEHDVAAFEADGSLLRAVLVARRHTPTRCTGSTYLFFHKPTAARLMWLFVRPVHLLVERRLLAGAARALTSTRVDVPTSS
jgi:hypothetical protein